MRNRIGASMLAAALGYALAISTSHAANYPDHLVKVVVPFPAGGITDVVTRMIAVKLSERLGQQFFIENAGQIAPPRLVAFAVLKHKSYQPKYFKAQKGGPGRRRN